MLVHELIEKLEKMSPDAKVITQGCDCMGWAEDVIFDENDDTVVITRNWEPIV